MFTGNNPGSLLGASAGQGVPGLGFRFQRDERWAMANPVGLDGVYESFCPPYHADMAAAVRAFVALKFGPGGAYDPATGGPYRDNARVKAAAEPPAEALVAAVTEVAEYVWRSYGKFPGTVPTLFVRAYTQAHHLDPEFYDASYGPPIAPTWSAGTRGARRRSAPAAQRSLSTTIGQSRYWRTGSSPQAFFMYWRQSAVYQRSASSRVRHR
jgi:hypothetical protein